MPAVCVAGEAVGPCAACLLALLNPCLFWKSPFSLFFFFPSGDKLLMMKPGNKEPQVSYLLSFFSFLLCTSRGVT